MPGRSAAVHRRLQARLDRFAGRLRRRARPSVWTRLWGTVAAACFVVLLVTGALLMTAYEPSGALVLYEGSYGPLRGVTVSRAYASTLHVSLDVPGGLLVRQTHHWAALLLPAALLLQLATTFFGGTFRRPCRGAWALLVAVLLVVLAAGWSGYALPDDNLSGTGLRIVAGTTLAVPLVGTWLTSALFGGEVPGRIVEHLYVVHLLTPALVLALVALRRRLSWARARPRAGASLQEAGLFFATAGVLTLMAGTLTVAPVWRYGPSSGDAYAGSQPDWYTAFLDGALRLVPPGWELAVGAHTWTLAVLVPLAAIGLLVGLLTAWPLVEERLTRDRGVHPEADRPRDHPRRTALGVAGVTVYGVLWLSGSADVLATELHVAFEGVVRALRVVLLVGPPVAALVALTVCRTLREAEAERREHGAETGQVVQLPSGGFVELHEPPAPSSAPTAGPTPAPELALTGLAGGSTPPKET